MADKNNAKLKLDKLAEIVKGSTTNYAEYSKLIQAVEADKIKNRADLTRVLEESLNKRASDVQTVLASDDSDRLADEIVSLLKG